MTRNTQFSRTRSQRDSTFLGPMLGLIAGLAIAVVVAMYIIKAPMPFISYGGTQPRPSEAGNAINTLSTPVQSAS